MKKRRLTPRDFALKLLSKREYPVFGLQEKLQKAYPEQPDEIKEVMDEFLEEGWVSDERFTEGFIRYQLLTTAAGPYVISQKLKQKGIDMDLIQQKIQEILPQPEQLDRLEILSEKKLQEIRRRHPEASDFEVQQKCMTFLSGKGYDLDLILTTMSGKQK